MASYNIGLSTDSKKVYVSIGEEALPVGATNVLTDFTHNGEGDEVGAYAGSHVLYHHVRDALYHEGIYDMQSVEIIKHGPQWDTVGLRVTELEEIEEEDTATLEIKYLPSLDTATNSHFTYESSDPEVATVSTAGVVTGVAEGTATITVTHKDLDISVEVPVTVVTPEVE